MPKIILLVDKNGKSQSIVRGIAGSACTKADEFLTSALGDVMQETKTEEYDGITLFENNTNATEATQVRRNVNFID